MLSLEDQAPPEAVTFLHPRRPNGAGLLRPRPSVSRGSTASRWLATTAVAAWASTGAPGHGPKPPTAWKASGAASPLTALQPRLHVPFDQPGRPPGFAGGQRVPDSVVGEPVLLMPSGSSGTSAGRFAQGGHRASWRTDGGSVTSGARHPAAAQKVDPLQLLQLPLAICSAGHRVAQQAT